MRTLERSDPITRLSPTIRRRTCVVVIAVLAAAITWLLAHAAGADMHVTWADNQNSMTVTAPSVIATSAVASLAGWATLTVLERRRRSIRAWRTLAVVSFFVSLAPVISAGAPTHTTTKAVLVAMHAIVTAIIITELPGTLSDQPNSQLR